MNSEISKLFKILKFKIIIKCICFIFIRMDYDLQNTYLYKVLNVYIYIFIILQKNIYNLYSFA